MTEKILFVWRTPELFKPTTDTVSKDKRTVVTYILTGQLYLYKLNYRPELDTNLSNLLVSP